MKEMLTCYLSLKFEDIILALCKGSIGICCSGSSFGLDCQHCTGISLSLASVLPSTTAAAIRFGQAFSVASSTIPHYKVNPYCVSSRSCGVTRRGSDDRRKRDTGKAPSAAVTSSGRVAMNQPPWGVSVQRSPAPTTSSSDAEARFPEGGSRLPVPRPPRRWSRAWAAAAPQLVRF
jgi:hypothetical protein